MFTGRQDVDADVPAEYAGPENVSTSLISLLHINSVKFMQTYNFFY